MTVTFTLHFQLSTINYPRPNGFGRAGIINYPLSIINYPLSPSTFNFHLSTINY
jgi:hypothetical protein